MQPTLRVGPSAGRVIAGAGAPAADLNGEVWLLPGCTTLPASLAEYRRTHTVQLMAVRGGTYRFDLATAGPSLAVVRIRNRELSTQLVEVAPATSSAVDLNAGPTRP